METPPPPKAILWAGLIAGTLDISAACIEVGIKIHMSPFTLFPSRGQRACWAAGVEGGVPTGRARIADAFHRGLHRHDRFLPAEPRFPVLLRHPVLSGLTFGRAFSFSCTG